MYLYDVSFKAEKIIRKCLKVIEGLNLPISNSIRFIEIKGSDNYGSCVYNGTKSFCEYTVGINKYIINEKDYEDTVIHELIHTINGCNKTHNNIWNKYAEDVRRRTNYSLFANSYKELELGAYLI